MVKFFSINRLLVNIAALLCIATLFIATSCNQRSNSFNRHSYLDSYICEDTLSSYNLSLYARVPYSYNHSVLPVIIVVTTPLGIKYADTLKFPSKERGVEAKKVQSGTWQDFEWSYRRGVIFSNKGKWNFAIIQDTLGLELDRVGQMGIIVSKSK